MLTKMLNESGALNHLAKPDQAVYMKLAHIFQDNTQYLFLSPEELYESTGLGTKELWKELLNLQETKSYIKGSMAFLAQVAQRKTFHSLVQSALEGNTQAAKQIQDLSGVLNNVDSNKIIILTHIPRPNTNKQEETQ